MEKGEIVAKIDHTLLKPFTTKEQVFAICKEVEEYHMASGCIPPTFVKDARKAFPKINLCTVVGFPTGYQSLATKIFETKDALENGANEIDMVISLGYAKSGEWQRLQEEIAAIKDVCQKNILKVIIETCYLTEQEKINLCHCVTNAKADYIKTSTGFGTFGATFDDVKLFLQYLGKGIKIKAAGGIKQAEDIEAYLTMGCHRIGTSNAVAALELK